jgi:uncharacterized protein
MKIGVISDTHGFLDPRVFELFAGIEHILHAGDVGPHSLLVELGRIAPVTAVLGNTDSLSNLRLTEMVVLAGHKFLVHHILNPSVLKDELRLRIGRDRPHVVVFGHTHQRFHTKLDGVRYLNPGYAGKPKPGTERSVALLHCDNQELWHEFLPL